jgi:hypothetical protein
MYFDKFDICEAHYIFAMLYHGGQCCPIYAKFAQLDRIGFRASPMLTHPNDLNENARSIYDDLVEKHN